METLTGTVNAVASAQDNVSVASLQFSRWKKPRPQFDCLPYPYSLNTTSVERKPHSRLQPPTGWQYQASSAGMQFVVNNSSTAPPVVSITAPSSEQRYRNSNGSGHCHERYWSGQCATPIDGAMRQPANGCTVQLQPHDKISKWVVHAEGHAKDTAGNQHVTSTGDKVTG